MQQLIQILYKLMQNLSSTWFDDKTSFEQSKSNMNMENNNSPQLFLAKQLKSYLFSLHYSKLTYKQNSRPSLTLDHIGIFDTFQDHEAQWKTTGIKLTKAQ